MRPPCELVQREFLPAFRSELTHALYERGLSQNQIAARLEITQAAVSKYLKHPVEPAVGKRAIDTSVQKIVEMIEAEEAQADAMVKILCSTCMSLRIGSDLCHRHRETVESLGEAKCKICNELLGGHKELVRRAGVLEDMEQAIRMIEQTRGFIRLLPQVRASLVACSAEAKTADQVVGVPGRITDIKGRAMAPAEPEYGASQHTASILLWAKEKIPRVRACICISGREEIARSVEEIGFTLIRLKEPASEVDQISRLADKAMKSVRAERCAIHIPGGFGVEPVIYLFGKTATELAEMCETIALHLS